MGKQSTPRTVSPDRRYGSRKQLNTINLLEAFCLYWILDASTSINFMHYHWIGITVPKDNCKMGPSELLMLCMERLLKGVQPFLLPNAFPMQITWPSRAAAVINAYQRHPLSSGPINRWRKSFELLPERFSVNATKSGNGRKKESKCCSNLDNLYVRWALKHTHTHTETHTLNTLGVKALKGTVNSSMRLCTVSTNGI